jgi:hypothetical protein
MGVGTTYVVTSDQKVKVLGSQVGGIKTVTLGALDSVTYLGSIIDGIEELIIGADGEINRVKRITRAADGSPVPNSYQYLSLEQHAEEFFDGIYIIPGVTPAP